METQTDLLAELHEEINQEPVSTGIRFANYIIDIVIFYVLVVLIALLLASLEPEGQDKAFVYLITYLIYVGYYTAMEGATQGRTIGKLITGSKVIKEEGSPITWKDALMRSLARIVPFEPFSALGGYPWHDKWTKTKVIKSKNKF